MHFAMKPAIDINYKVKDSFLVITENIQVAH